MRPEVALSICIPTYRRPVLVQKAVASAIASSRSWIDSVELIVSDNSPEETADVCQAALAQWPGRALYLANRPSIGMVANLNQCIARASGQRLLFVHDDDYLLPSATGAILSAIRTATERDAVLLFGIQVVDGNGHLRHEQSFRREQYLSPASAMTRVLSDPSFVRNPAIVIRRSVFDAVGGFDETLGNPTDFDLYLRIFARFGVRCMPTTISAYTVHEEALTTRTFTTETVRTNLRIFDRAAALGILPPHVIPKCEADWFCRFILAGVNRRLSVGDRQGAAEIMDLFRMPELRRLGVALRWLPIRAGMQLLIAAPARVSQASARRLEYRGGWSSRFQLIGQQLSDAYGTCRTVFTSLCR